MWAVTVVVSSPNFGGIMNKTIYKEALDLWGFDTQLEMIVEECAELIHAIKKYKRDKCGVYDVIEECADVEIMLEQMREVFNSEIENCKLMKIERLKNRIKIEKEKQIENNNG